MRFGTLDAFTTLISWYQIIVHDDASKGGFNAWRLEHVRQGFAWRKGSVSFATLDVMDMDVRVSLEQEARLRREAARAVRVPYSVTASSRILVVASFSQREIKVPEGQYMLTYQHGLQTDGGRMWCTLTFVPSGVTNPEILVVDSELSPPKVLVMEAEPVE